MMYKLDGTLIVTINCDRSTLALVHIRKSPTNPYSLLCCFACCYILSFRCRLCYARLTTARPRNWPSVVDKNTARC
jgi:hypothetical protein